MDQTLARAFIDGTSSQTHSGARLLGVRLRKFCLWHRLLLKAVNSPFLTRGEVTMRDFRIAAGICRLRPFDSKIRKPWLAPVLIYAWATAASLWPRKWRSATFTRGMPQNPLQRALTKRRDVFLDYCYDYLAEPEYTIIPPARQGSTPSPSRGKLDDCVEHVGELIAWGIPEWRAWEMPIGIANTYRVMARRDAGNDVDVVTGEEKAFMKTVPPQFRAKR